MQLHGMRIHEKVNDKLTKLERENFDKEDPIRMVIVRLGYSRVELAATVSERLEGKGVVQAISVDSSMLPTTPPGNKEAALKLCVCISLRGSKLGWGG
ncbi:hypothetical protein Tco_1264871 [Tanacetum coccineum]